MCVQWCDFPTSPPGEIATARAQDLVANDLFLFFHLFLHWFQVHSEWLDSHVLTEGSFHFPRATMHSYQSTSGSTLTPHWTSCDYPVTAKGVHGGGTEVPNAGRERVPDTRKTNSHGS